VTNGFDATLQGQPKSRVAARFDGETGSENHRSSSLASRRKGFPTGSLRLLAEQVVLKIARIGQPRDAAPT
jgi:hypothetical protein